MNHKGWCVEAAAGAEYQRRAIAKLRRQCSRGHHKTEHKLHDSFHEFTVVEQSGFVMPRESAANARHDPGAGGKADA